MAGKTHAKETLSHEEHLQRPALQSVPSATLEQLPLRPRKAPYKGMLLALTDIATIAAITLGGSLLLPAALVLPPYVTANLPAMTVIGKEAPPALAFFIFQALTIPLAIGALGIYGDRFAARPWARAGLTVAAVLGPTLAFFSILDILRMLSVWGHLLVLDGLVLAVALSSWRFMGAAKRRHELSRGQGAKNVLIVGSGATAQIIAQELVRDVGHSRRVVGFLAEGGQATFEYIPDKVFNRRDVWAPWKDVSRNGNGNGTSAIRRTVAAQTTEVDGLQLLKPVVVENVNGRHRHLLAPVGTTSLTDVQAAVDGLCVQEVFVTADVSDDAVARVIRICRAQGVDVHLVPQQYPDLGVVHEPWRLGSYPMVGLYKSPIREPQATMKRALDIVGGLFGLAVFSPILLLSAIAIKLENWRRPIFYWGRRVGQKGHPFKILKLATMVPDADRYRDQLRGLNAREGPWFQIDESKDPRITRVGRFLRKYTINEIPQFWNVVKGDMSLVGPRPLAPDEVANFVDYDFRYYRAFDVKPGMTSLWAIKSRSDPSFEKRISYDFEYIQKWSLWLDIKILLATPFAVLGKQKGR